MCLTAYRIAVSRNYRSCASPSNHEPRDLELLVRTSDRIRGHSKIRRQPPDRREAISLPSFRKAESLLGSMRANIDKPSTFFFISMNDGMSKADL
jgi:hypothetical protein